MSCFIGPLLSMKKKLTNFKKITAVWNFKTDQSSKVLKHYLFPLRFLISDGVPGQDETPRVGVCFKVMGVVVQTWPSLGK